MSEPDYTSFINWIDEEMNSVAIERKDDLSTALITKIPSSCCYYNSVTITVGRQRSGKTFTTIREISKISYICHNTHVLLYVNNTGILTDKTFENYRHKINLPIVYISHDDFEDYLRDMLKWKQLYNEIKHKKLELKIKDEQRDELFEKLFIEDFDSPFLHTLIMFEDVTHSKMLTKKNTYLKELLTQCAHINCSFFLVVHYWRAVNLDIKTQATTVFVFGGFSKQQLRYILSQLNTTIELEEYWEKYRALGEREKMLIDTRTRDVEFNPK